MIVKVIDFDLDSGIASVCNSSDYNDYARNTPRFDIKFKSGTQLMRGHSYSITPCLYWEGSRLIHGKLDNHNSLESQLT